MESPGEVSLCRATSTHMLTGWENSLSRAQIVCSYSSIMVYLILVPPWWRTLSYKAIVPGNNKKGCSGQEGAEDNPSTSHTLTHEKPVPPQHLNTMGRARSFNGPGHDKGWARSGGPSRSSRRQDWKQGMANSMLREKEKVFRPDLKWSPVTWVGCVGGGPRWGLSGQLRLISMLRSRQRAVRLVIGGKLSRLLQDWSSFPSLLFCTWKLHAINATNKSWDFLKVPGTSPGWGKLGTLSPQEASPTITGV